MSDDENPGAKELFASSWVRKVIFRLYFLCGALLTLGIGLTFFLFFAVNMSMVMGLAPVVGVPLPLVSYGGTAMLTVMIGFGLLMNVYVHRDVRIGRRWSDHG